MTRLTPRLALLMTLPPALWAGNAVVDRLMVGHVPPLTLNFLRWALALGLLLPFGWRVLREPRALLERAPQLLLLGTLGVGAYNALQYLALVSTTPINVTLIAASMPVWMLAIGAAVYGVHPTPLSMQFSPVLAGSLPPAYTCFLALREGARVLAPRSLWGLRNLGSRPTTRAIPAPDLRDSRLASATDPRFRTSITQPQISRSPA